MRSCSLTTSCWALAGTLHWQIWHCPYPKTAGTGCEKVNGVIFLKWILISESQTLNNCKQKVYLYGEMFCMCRSVLTMPPRHQTISVPNIIVFVVKYMSVLSNVHSLYKMSRHKSSEHCKCMSCVSLMWTAAVKHMCTSLITQSLHISTSTYLRTYFASIILHFQHHLL